MVERYRFTSKAFEGHILFTYEDKVCIAVEFDANLSNVQLDYFTANFPMRTSGLDAIVGRSGKVEVIEPDLSFDSFWSAYGNKINRKRTFPLWDKLTDTDRAAVFSALPKYRYYTKAKGISMANPENYLRDRRWEDELNIK